MVVSSDCPGYLIYSDHNHNMWRVACGNGKLYGPSGLYSTKEQAIEAVKATGCPYEVIDYGPDKSISAL